MDQPPPDLAELQLEEAERAFAQGDYQRARQLALGLTRGQLRAGATQAGGRPPQPEGESSAPDTTDGARANAPGQTVADRAVASQTVADRTVADRAEQLLERLRPDPLIRYLLALTALLLLILIGFSYRSGGAP